MAALSGQNAPQRRHRRRVGQLTAAHAWLPQRQDAADVIPPGSTAGAAWPSGWAGWRAGGMLPWCSSSRRSCAAVGWPARAARRARARRRLAQRCHPGDPGGRGVPRKR
eukprot:4115542-Lingulodinium_polyedra.AAC.1